MTTPTNLLRSISMLLANAPCEAVTIMDSASGQFVRITDVVAIRMNGKRVLVLRAGAPMFPEPTKAPG